MSSLASNALQLGYILDIKVWNNSRLSRGLVEMVRFWGCSTVGLALGIIRLGGSKKMKPYIKNKNKNHWKISLRMVCAAKLLIKLLYSIFFNKSCSIDNMVNLFNLSCDIVDHK